MLNDSGSVPPAGGGSSPEKPDTHAAKAKPTGQFQFTEGKKFLGMTFTAKQWNQFMNILQKNLSSFMSRVFQKMKEKLKKDFQRSQGENPD